MHDNLPFKAGVRSQSGGRGTVGNGHPLADASVPRVASTASIARVTVAWEREILMEVVLLGKDRLRVSCRYKWVW